MQEATIMALRVAIVTDSTSNIPRLLAAERRIYIVPLYVIWGVDSLKDGIEITEQELFQRMAQSGDMPTTSQATVSDFVAIFEEARASEQADEIVCAVISCDLSGTYASAMQAKATVNFPVHVIDTRQASWGLGFPVLSGADARDAGASAPEIVEAITAAARRTSVVFTVETLDYLRRGGRIGKASWLLGTALNIKPVLELEDGVVAAADKVRTRKRAVDHLLTVTAKRAAGRPIQRLGIIHAEAEEEAKALFAKAVEQFQPQESCLTYATSAIGAHIGPGAIGVIVQWEDGAG
jgi:DegV family protein with EDD domain